MQRKDGQRFAWDEALALEQSFNLALMTMDVQRHEKAIAARVYRRTESLNVEEITQEIWRRAEHSFNRSRQELLIDYEVFFRA